MEEIQKVIETEIRPLLQRDGGDLQIIDYRENILTIRYQGACGGCPHAAEGTKNFIEAILREKVNPKLTVQLGH